MLLKKITLVLIKSLIVNITLTIIKIIFGFICKSKVLIADGTHSLSDFATDIVSIFGSKLSGKPADEEHPYGHGKLEYLTSIVIGSFVLALAISLIVGAFKPTQVIPNNMVLYVTIFTIVAKYLLVQYIYINGHKYKSSLLLASARESRADVLSSLIVVIIFFLSKLNKFHDIFNYADSFGSFIVGLIVLRTAYNILKENVVSILGEKEQDEEYLKQIRKIILSHNEVKKIEELDIIKYGHYYQASITIDLDSNITIFDCDRIVNRIKKDLESKKTRISYVKISVNPYME